MNEYFQEIEQAVHKALGTYSNVHRGSGHHSLVTTQLYEQARDIVLTHLGLDKKKHVVIFCTPRRATMLQARLGPGSHRCVSSKDLGLPLGIRALAVERKALRSHIPFDTGGGTARLVAPGWVIWARSPDRFEAGTPAIVNVIAFALGLKLMKRFGKDTLPFTFPAPSTSDEGLGHDDLDCYFGRELLYKLRQLRIGRDAHVPTMDGDRSFVNLDNGASTPTFQPIWDTVQRAWHKPHNEHQAIFQQTRLICAEVLGAPLASHEVIFTSNTTEAINLVAESLGKEAALGSETVVLNTLLEHNSNELPWRTTPGLSLVRLEVDHEGFIDLAKLEDLLVAYNQTGQHGRKRIKLVTVSGASNVLGVYNDLAAISRIAHRYGALILVDAAQWVAHRKMEMEAWGIDYLAFSGHKVYAPFGTGVLLAKKKSLAFSALDMEQIHSSGEENVGGVAGLAKALTLLRRIGFHIIQEEEQALTRRALVGLTKLSRVKVYGIKDPHSFRFEMKGGVIVFELKGMMPHRVARALALRGGIGVRYGCHCAHLLMKRLLGVPPWAEKLQYLMLKLSSRINLPGLVRVSFGLQTTLEEVDRLIEVLGRIANQRQTKRMGRQMDAYLSTATQKVYGRI